MTTITLSACHGTHLTDAERRAGERAAKATFERLGVDPLEAHKANVALASDAPYDKRAADAYAEAEIAAATAACEGWYRVAEDLCLEISA